MSKDRLHFLPNKLINSTDAISISVIGAGGTGSAFVREMIDIAILLRAIKDKEIDLHLLDYAKVKESNMGRQNFYPEDIGDYKAETLIKRINRNYGFSWKYYNKKVTKTYVPKTNIIVLCVDNIEARKIVYEYDYSQGYYHDSNRVFYFLDMGNDQHTAQVFLSTNDVITQPKVKDIDTVSFLQNPFEYFGEQTIFRALEQENNIPSCSSYQAIQSQDLFINKAVAMQGAKIIWNMFMNNYVRHQAYFINHETENFKALRV